MSTRPERALGALTGLALGDALGMPTQSMSRSAIGRIFGSVDGLQNGPPEQPIAPGMPAGSVTDDTEQAVLVARMLIQGHGHVEPRRFADELIRWESQMRAKGSLDLLGPSTKAAIAAIQAGVAPDQAGSGGTTNGAAMRVAPVGVAWGPSDSQALLQAVHDLSFVTHNTGLGLSAAAAIGGCVSAGVEGADVDDALSYGIDLSHRAGTLGRWMAGASVPTKATWSMRQSKTMTLPQLAEFLDHVVGTSVQSQESVVSALVIADYFRDDPYQGLCFAATLGGDTDTMAAMAGAVLGSVFGVAAFPSDTIAQVMQVSSLNLEELVQPLLSVRSSPVP